MVSAKMSEASACFEHALASYRSLAIGGRTVMAEAHFISESDRCRFWAKVNIAGPDECWLWTGYIHPNGYGQFRFNGRTSIATRVAWSIANNQPFPSGMDACHSCDNPACVNPSHLWPGTESENMQDSLAKNRFYRGFGVFKGVRPTHCKRGHEFTPENTITFLNGYTVSEETGRSRRCRACTNERNKAAKAAKRKALADARMCAAVARAIREAL